VNAMEKVAWIELVVSVAAVVVVTLLFPWLGFGAFGGFALLALTAVGAVFVRQRGSRVVVDERDRQIERRATTIGIRAAWGMLWSALLVATLWSSYANEAAVSTTFLTWLLWIQFAVCYGIKGLAGVLMYRRQRRAA
jgi:hypothetical protein